MEGQQHQVCESSQTNVHIADYHPWLVSSSGRPATTPAGHARAWTHSVKWNKASVFDPSSYAHLLAESTAVVHSMGVLLEGGKYKEHVRSGNVLGLVGDVLGLGRGGSSGGVEENPLKRGRGRGREKEGGGDEMSYQKMNKESGENR